MSPEAKAILESLSVGQEIPYGVTNAGGDNRSEWTIRCRLTSPRMVFQSTSLE